jgi:hypothetical protein
MNVIVGTTIILAATLIIYKLLTPVSKPTRKKGPVKKKEPVQKKEPVKKKEPAQKKESTKKVNPYFAFCKEKRPDIVAANPELKPREIVKKLGEEWGKLSDKEKDEYRITSS